MVAEPRAARRRGTGSGLQACSSAPRTSSRPPPSAPSG